MTSPTSSPTHDLDDRRHRRLGEPSRRPEGDRGDHSPALGLHDDALELTWRSLSELGNLSSASVLHVLRDTLDRAVRRRAARGC